MKNTFSLLILLFITISCAKEDATIEYRTIEKIIEVEVPGETITETVIVNNPLAPDSYSFTRDGVSTVYYTGQSAKLEKWSFHRLEIGDSFAIPFEDNELEVTRLRTAASAYSGRHRVRLVTRTTEEEGTKMLRVWRTE